MFETITERDLNDVICGICGICPEVCLGDGNEKNCCNNAEVIVNLILGSNSVQIFSL
jgi:hypothetical protein